MMKMSVAAIFHFLMHSNPYHARNIDNCNEKIQQFIHLKHPANSPESYEEIESRDPHSLDKHFKGEKL